MYAYAATQAQVQAQNLLTKINEAILFPLITLMMALALLIFLYGAFEYVKGAASDGDRETGKRHLLWGTIGMLVMLSALSILYVAAGTFGLDDELDSAIEEGSDNGFFSNFLGDDEDDASWNDRGPSQSDYFSGGGGTYADLDDDGTYADSDNDGTYTDIDNDGTYADIEDGGGGTGGGDTGPSGIEISDNNPFSDGIEPSFFSFYEDKINDAQQSGTITRDEIKGFFSQPNGEYPDNYLLYENTELMPWCENMGGLDVFSISVNNDTSRMFCCITNL